MELLTKKIRESLPPLYSQDGLGLEALAQVKFFTPDNNWTWYAISAAAYVQVGDEPSVDMTLKEAMDKGLNQIGDANESGKLEDVVFFGLVVGLETELGYFHLSELESAKGPFGMKIERDLWFKPTPLKDCK